MTVEEYFTPAWVGLIAGAMGYFVRSTVDKQMATGITALVSKLDELKGVISILTVQLARMEEKHSSLLGRVDAIELRLSEPHRRTATA